MPYEKVCFAFDVLDSCGLTTREGLHKYPQDKLIGLLKLGGMRFPNQTAKFLKGFGENEIDLERCSREELVSHVAGMGYKLASMFLRNTRGEPFAVLDVHIKNWLKEQGKLGKNYFESEKNFFELASKLNMTPQELDYKIWNERRIGNRRKTNE